jgi:hypothetical protein
MSKFVLFIVFVLMLLHNYSFSNEPEDEALVVIIYPHFFNNTRTLISKIDSIVNHNSPENEFFIYVSNELSPSTYFDRDLLFDLMDKLSFSYGNLVPNYSFDIENINKNENYLKLINNENISAISYAFFTPREFWDFLSGENKRKSLNNMSYELGIIPKKVLDKGKKVSINVYLPKNTSPENFQDIENVQFNLNEI